MYAKAERALSRHSPVFRQLIRDVGPCTLQPEADSFKVLLRMVVGQLISTVAARTIVARIEALLGAGNVTPAAFVTRSEEEFRACGLSRPKIATIRGLAEHALADPEFFPSLRECEDAEVIRRLVPFRGIGPWTGEMFLIFSLGRLDVWPVTDLGVQLGVRDMFKLLETPTPREMRPFADAWRPYRTVAAWYLWRSRGFVPQSGQ